MPSSEGRGALKHSVNKYSAEYTLKAILWWQQREPPKQQKIDFSGDFDTSLLRPVNSSDLGALEANYSVQSPALWLGIPTVFVEGVIWRINIL